MGVRREGADLEGSRTPRQGQGARLGGVHLAPVAASRSCHGAPLGVTNPCELMEASFLCSFPH